MTLILDVDGVIADFCGAIDRIVRQVSPNYVPTWTQWDIAPNLPPGAWPIVKTALLSPLFARNIPEFPGACKLVRDALDEGLDIVFGTAPFEGSKTWAHDRKEWLRDRFGSRIEVVSLDAKHRLRGDALCDDKPGHLEAWPTNTRYLIDRPYNQGAFAFTYHRCDLAFALSHYRALKTVRSGYSSKDSP